MSKCTICKNETEYYRWCNECIKKWKDTPNTSMFSEWVVNRVREIERNKTEKIIKAAENLIADCFSIADWQLSPGEKEPQDLLQEEIDKYRQQND